MAGTTGSDFTEHVFPARDGLLLYARTYGQTAKIPAIPVVCLPGLSRNSRDFHLLAQRLSADPEKPRRVVSVDYRGRGLSAWDPDKSHYQLSVEADDVVAACAALDIREAIFIGTSRGGLILHILAAMAPHLLRGIVLNDIGPVIEIAGLLQIREYLEARPVFDTWQGAVEHLKAVHGPAFPILDEADWDDMARAIFRNKDGAILPDFDPTLIEPLRNLDAESQIPDLWQLYDGMNRFPLMTIRGEHSTILSEATLEEMARRHGYMRSVTAGGQGHAPVLHRAEIFPQIQSFLDGI